MGKMAESVGVTFDPKIAGSYSYKYDDSKIDHYLYLAFEALCYSCGCFTWSDIGMLKICIVY
jgi:hypothetical protein